MLTSQVQPVFLPVLFEAKRLRRRAQTQLDWTEPEAVPCLADEINILERFSHVITLLSRSGFVSVHDGLRSSLSLLPW